MKLEKIIEALKDRYSDHDDLDEMVDVSSSKKFFMLNFWAERLCDKDEFDQGQDLWRALLKRWLQVADSCDDYRNLAEFASTSLNDKAWAKEICQKALKLAEGFYDYYNLAETVLSSLDDKAWAKEMFQKAEEKADAVGDYRSLAGSSLNDKAWAKEMFQKALKLADSCGDYQRLAEVASASLNDKEWVKEIFQKALNLAESSYDYLELGESVSTSLHDKEWVKEIFQKAEETADDADDYELLADRIKNEDYLGDKDWSKKLYEKADRIRDENPETTEVCYMSGFDFDELIDKIYDLRVVETLGQGEKMENIGRGMVNIECVKIEAEENDDCIRIIKYLNVMWQCDDSPIFKFISDPEKKKEVAVDKSTEYCVTLPDGRIFDLSEFGWDHVEYSDAEGNETPVTSGYFEEMLSDFDDPDDDDDDDDDF